MLAVSVVTCLALLAHFNRRVFLRGLIRSVWSTPRQAGISLALASAATLACAAIGSPLGVATAVPLLALLALCDTADFMSFRFFGTALNESIFHLPISLRGLVTAKIAGGYLRSYFPETYLLASACVLVALPLVTAPWLPPASHLVLAGAPGLALGLAISTWRQRGPLGELSMTERRIAFASDAVTGSILERATRDGSFALSATTSPPPETIVLMILESAGDALPASEDPNRLLSERIVQLSGAPGGWITPANAICNSSCTDIALPVILTGCGPHESAAKLHRLPFLFDLAKARGLRTGFFTSSSLHWANLDSFLDGAPIDRLFTADSTSLPFVNDICVDDHVAARQLTEWIDAATTPTLAVFYSTALHVPYQADSEIEIPATLTTRQARATFIVEQQLDMLFARLHASGRFERSLVLVVGDHGEIAVETGGDAAPFPSRLAVLSEAVIRPLFLLKPPSNLAPDRLEALRRNAGRLISHLDIAPTIADLLGTELTGDLAYAGQSLLRPLDGDRVVYTLNTNEWRTWPRSAVGIFRGEAGAIVDYLDHRLCRAFGAADTTPGQDALLWVGLNEPLVQRALTRVYRERLNL